MRIGSVSENLSAMKAISISQQATAHNVANVNTDEFHTQEVHLETGPEGQEVRVSEVRESSSSGPVVTREVIAETPPRGTEEVQTAVETSNTDIAHEMTGMIVDEHAFAANAESARTQTELVGGFIDEVV